VRGGLAVYQRDHGPRAYRRRGDRRLLTSQHGRRLQGAAVPGAMIRAVALDAP
jgi:hypothetical protein